MKLTFRAQGCLARYIAWIHVVNKHVPSAVTHFHSCLHRTAVRTVRQCEYSTHFKCCFFQLSWHFVTVQVDIVWHLCPTVVFLQCRLESIIASGPSLCFRYIFGSLPNKISRSERIPHAGSYWLL